MYLSSVVFHGSRLAGSSRRAGERILARKLSNAGKANTRWAEMQLSGSRLSDVDEVRLSLYSPAGTNGKSAAGDVAAVGQVGVHCYGSEHGSA